MSAKMEYATFPKQHFLKPACHKSQQSSGESNPVRLLMSAGVEVQPFCRDESPAKDCMIDECISISSNENESDREDELYYPSDQEDSCEDTISRKKHQLRERELQYLTYQQFYHLQQNKIEHPDPARVNKAESKSQYLPVIGKAKNETVGRNEPIRKGSLKGVKRRGVGPSKKLIHSQLYWAKMSKDIKQHEKSQY